MTGMWHSATRRAPERVCKDALDLLLAMLLIVALAPVFVVTTVLVSATSPGPILYRRRVLGVDGVEFDAFKFRTMRRDADAILHSDPTLRREYETNVKLRADPRLTPLGTRLRRLSLDELPQLFNVLRGEMSLVGPRMITRAEAARYGDAAAKRLSVKPGMTGLWQVSGRQEVGYDERIALDLYYIDHWSLWLDLKILLQTVPVVLSMRGAY